MRTVQTIFEIGSPVAQPPALRSLGRIGKAGQLAIVLVGGAVAVGLLGVGALRLARGTKKARGKKKTSTAVTYVTWGVVTPLVAWYSWKTFNESRRSPSSAYP